MARHLHSIKTEKSDDFMFCRQNQDTRRLTKLQSLSHWPSLQAHLLHLLHSAHLGHLAYLLHHLVDKTLAPGLAHRTLDINWLNRGSQLCLHSNLMGTKKRKSMTAATEWERATKQGSIYFQPLLMFTRSHLCPHFKYKPHPVKNWIS